MSIFLTAEANLSERKSLLPTVSGNNVIGTPIEFVKFVIDDKESVKYPDLTLTFKGTDSKNNGYVSDKIFGNTFDTKNERYNTLAVEKNVNFITQFLKCYIPDTEYRKGLNEVSTLISEGDNDWLALLKVFFKKNGVFNTEFAKSVKGEAIIVLSYNEKRYEIKKDKYAKVISTELFCTPLSIAIDNVYTKVTAALPDKEPENVDEVEFPELQKDDTDEIF